jgi:hypothetical protein
MRHLEWVTEELLAEVERLEAELGRVPGSVHLGRRLGINREKARRLARWLKTERGVDPSATGWTEAGVGREAAPVERPCSVEEGDRTAVASGRVVAETRVQSLAALLEAAQVDEAIWYVKKWIANRWEMPSSRADAGKLPMWQVKAWLERKVPLVVSEAAEELMLRMAEHAPSYPKLADRQVLDPHLLEVALYDHHFGKLAWRRETGQDYDLKLAEQVWRDAVEDVLAKVAGYPVERVLFPIGNDFFNYDDPRGTTEKGTPQDNDSRPHKVFLAGVMAAVHAIDLCAQLAPVDVVYVPGNHDPTMGYHLAVALWAWYRKHDRVSVDIGPKARKYYVYGRALIGLTHGDLPAEMRKTLPTIMSTEAKDEWHATDHHEWHIGHWHKRSEMRTLPLDSYGGVPVRVLPSLTGTDAWHYHQGFVGNRRATDAYLWSRAEGLTGYFTSYVREQP